MDSTEELPQRTGSPDLPTQPSRTTAKAGGGPQASHDSVQLSGGSRTLRDRSRLQRSSVEAHDLAPGLMYALNSNGEAEPILGTSPGRVAYVNGPRSSNMPASPSRTLAPRPSGSQVTLRRVSVGLSLLRPAAGQPAAAPQLERKSMPARSSLRATSPVRCVQNLSVPSAPLLRLIV